MAGGEVKLIALVKQFGDVTAVDGIDLEMPGAEFFSMLGPSGCGKTTTLRMIAGFEQPTSGQILLDGEDMAFTPPHKRNVNTVFQSYALFPHLSVQDNVAFGLRRQKTPKNEIKQRVGEALELVQLTGLERRKPAQMSGGQQQRVALARALVLKPAVLLLDEPLGALDAKLRKALQIELKALQQQVGITFIYVTHDQEEALTMSDSIAVMNRGVIEQLDNPEEIYERPSTTFVAGFIGVSNLMPGEVVSTGAGAAELRLDAGPTVRAGAAGAQVGERAHAVVRPEKLELHGTNGAGSDGRPSVDGQVESSLYLGTATQVIVRLPDDTRMTVLVPNTDEEARRRLPMAGDGARLTWSTENIHMVRDTVATAAEGEEGSSGE